MALNQLTVPLPAYNNTNDKTDINNNSNNCVTAVAISTLTLIYSVRANLCLIAFVFFLKDSFTQITQ